ncbi:MAG: T9SS type A sorting domain-containing protein, partial [Bacteroidota bacterium]
IDFYLEADENLALNQPNLRHPWLSLKEPLQVGKNTLIVDARNLAPSDFLYEEWVNLSAFLQTAPCLDFFQSFRISVEVLPSNVLSVTHLTIVDSDANQDACAAFGTGPQDIPTVAEFAFDAGCLPENFSFRASTYGDVKSVIFKYSYTAPGEEEQPLEFLRNENVLPFAAFGDFPAGEYYGIPVKSGLYKIQVVPYSEVRARGKRGIPLEVHLRIGEPRTLPRQDDPAQKENLSMDDRLLVYPNPVQQEGHISYQVEQTGPLEINLFDLQGNLIRSIFKGNMKLEDRLEMDFKREKMEAGIYILRVIENKHSLIRRIIVE